MTIPNQPKSLRMPLQKSLAFHPQIPTILACNFKIDVSAFIIIIIILLLFSYCSCCDCHDHPLHYTAANNSVVSAAAAAAVVSAADVAAVLLHFPFCCLSMATFLSTSYGGLGHMMSLYCSGKYCRHLLYSSASLMASNCIGTMGSGIDTSHSLR